VIIAVVLVAILAAVVGLAVWSDRRDRRDGRQVRRLTHRGIRSQVRQHKAQRQATRSALARRGGGPARPR
jgi:hypothetical protein